MWIDKALPYGADILLSAYAVYRKRQTIRL